MNSPINQIIVREGALYVGGDYRSGDVNTVGERRQTLAEAAAEIQQLLNQLEKSNPSATDAEIVAYINDETPPSFKSRVASAVKTIRADAMILLQSEDSILHIEFQTLPKKKIPFRMADYRLRGYRRYEDKPMRKVVIYLKPTTSELIYQTSFTLENTRHDFQVIRLWEQPASLFLQYPGLLPFAALGQSDSPAEMLRQVTQIVDQIEDSTTQANLMAASAILAGLRLEEDVIYPLVQRDIMQESVIYQSIQKDEKRAIARNFLRDGLSVEAVARGTGLSIEEVQQLQQQLNGSAQS